MSTSTSAILDCRTILVRPRTPKDWVKLVNRMTIKPVVGEPIGEEESWAVSIYLIAITPDLQNSVKGQRKQQMQAGMAQVALQSASISSPDVIQNPDAVVIQSPDETSYDAEEAKILFEDTCSQCHELSDVDDVPPTTEEEIGELIARMIENGLFILEEDIEIIARYLNETYVNQ